MDRHGRALRPIIAWFDARASGYARRWEETVGAARVYAVAGQTLDGLFGANKIMWVRDHEPEVWARTAAWLSTEDWLLWRLTGEVATDYSMAARTMLFDRDRGEWSAELLAAADLDGRLMPPVLPSGSVLAGLSAEAAAATGLPAGTPVVMGGHDHLCAAFVARGGRQIPIDSTGTAEALVTPAASPPPGDPGLAAHVNCYRDVEPGRVALLSSVAFAGGLVDWLRRQVFRIGEDDPDAYARMMDEVRRPVRPNGLLCFPEFGRGASPRWDPAGARGAFVGLTQGHDRGDLLQAALEATCFSLRHNLAWVEEHLVRCRGTGAGPRRSGAQPGLGADEGRPDRPGDRGDRPAGGGRPGSGGARRGRGGRLSDPRRRGGRGGRRPAPWSGRIPDGRRPTGGCTRCGCVSPIWWGPWPAPWPRRPAERVSAGALSVGLPVEVGQSLLQPPVGGSRLHPPGPVAPEATPGCSSVPPTPTPAGPAGAPPPGRRGSPRPRGSGPRRCGARRRRRRRAPAGAARGAATGTSPRWCRCRGCRCRRRSSPGGTRAGRGSRGSPS